MSFHQIRRSLLLPDGEYGKLEKIELAPSAWKFVQSEADVAILLGPRGCGKSTAGMAGLLQHAARFPEARPLRGAIIRDTFTNLKRTTLETIQDGIRRGWWDAEIRDGGAEIILNGGVAKLYLMGMETGVDARRFQGLELGFAWIEEAAPADELGEGVSHQIVGMAQSSMRQRGVRPRLQITSNVPDEDHWLLHMGEQLPPGSRALSIKTFWMTKYDNAHNLEEGYYDRMIAAFIDEGRPDLADRFGEGKVGFVASGTPVTPEFGQAHIAPEGFLKFWEKFPIIRGWDFGLNPTCVWLTVLPSGRIHVLNCVSGSNIGLEQLINGDFSRMQEEMQMGRPRGTQGHGFGPGATSGCVFRDIGDPAGLQREQSNSDRSAAWTLQTMLNTSFEAAPPDWPARRDSLRAVLNQMIHGTPRLLIDPAAKALIRALRGGWRYHKLPDGRVSPLPIKDKHSHLGDALSYVTAVITPVQETVRRAQQASMTKTRWSEPPKSWVGM